MVLNQGTGIGGETALALRFPGFTEAKRPQLGDTVFQVVGPQGTRGERTPLRGKPGVSAHLQGSPLLKTKIQKGQVSSPRVWSQVQVEELCADL